MEMQSTDQKSGQQASMVISSDIWLAPSVTGYQEVRAFYTRMGEKLAFNPGGGMFMSSPEASRNMGELYKEIGKLDGIPVLQTISMGGMGQPGPGDASGQPGGGQQQQQQQQQQQTTEMSGFSSDPVDDSAFAVPAGFRKVENRSK